MKSLLTLPKEYIRPEWRTCAVPGRPWWTAPNGAPISCRVVGDFKSLDYDVFLKRRDGLVLTKEFLSNPDDALSYLATRPESCDTTRPLPHPGYRAGQVWAWPRPEDSQFPWQILQLGARGFFEITLPDPTPEVLYLLHDPVRPDLAPWSSL